MKKLLILTLIAAFTCCRTKEAAWDATGVFEATEVVVSAETSGVLKRFIVQYGMHVDSTEHLGYIDTVQLHLDKMRLRSTKRGVTVRSQDVSKQIASTHQQIQWLKGEKARYERLYTLNAATKQQVEELTNEISVQEKQLSAQQSMLERNNRGIADDGVSLDIQVAQINEQICRSIICSPITGNILTKYAEQGEFVATGSRLFTVADMKNLFLRAYITADMITQIKLGQQVKVYADFGDAEQREYQGKVVWIADKGEFTPKTIQTRDERANMVYAVKVAVTNDGYLKIGMYGQMVVE